MTDLMIGKSIRNHMNCDTQPRQIIFREITIEAKAKTGMLNIGYTQHGMPTIEDLDTVISRYQDYPPSSASTIAPLASLSKNPLDLNCAADSFIIFYLSSKWNWQFSPLHGAGFSTKQDCAGKYGNLMHVMKGGERIPVLASGNDGCRLLYFRAKCQKEEYCNGFNLHIDLLFPPDAKGNDVRMSLIIDPEVKHPGGSGNNPSD